MAKPSNRDKILEEGLRVVHQRGFAGAGVRDIVQAAGVPQGSFTNHFASKEAFGLEILNIYFSRAADVILQTLRNESLGPIHRLSAYIDAIDPTMGTNDARNGCLVGNYSADTCGQSEMIRTRVIEIFAELQESTAHCLQAGIQSGDFDASLDVEDMAGFIVESLQGAILHTKSTRDSAAMKRFRRVVFDTLLR